MHMYRVFLCPHFPFILEIKYHIIRELLKKEMHTIFKKDELSLGAIYCCYLLQTSSIFYWYNNLMKLYMCVRYLVSLKAI